MLNTLIANLKILSLKSFFRFCKAKRLGRVKGKKTKKNKKRYYMSAALAS